MPDNSELYESICKDLEDRQPWERRQILWTRMRNQGVKRQRLPWSGAANVHVPIGDTIISKLKPYYIQWIFGPELLASFYSLKDQGDSYTDSVAQWFDYQVRECSNFTVQAICAIDSCLQNGMGFLKTYWDVGKEELAFASIHPYFIILPTWSTYNLNEADRVTHVMHYSRAQYLRDAEARGLNTDESFLDSITGEGKPDSKYEQVRYTAEGLSWSRLKDLIILWEVYQRETDGQITVETFSPLQPDEPAREPFKLPYQHKQTPIVQIPYEIIDGGFYSSRGVMELTQMFEASACKMWNEKLDYMSISNRPVLSTQGGSINAQNIRWEPGAAYDGNIQIVQQPPPPVSFDEEITNTRSLAEQRVGIPDFGIGQDNQFDKSRTATETNAIATVMQQSNDLRARVSKDVITRVYEQSWSILRQYKSDSLDYFWRGQRITLEDAAFDNKYVLRPNGSVDGYSREREIQKLMQLRQLAQGSPWLKLPEVDRKIVELMDAQWINQVFEEPQDIQADQSEQQAIENTVLSDGFPAQVKPNDAHVLHLQTLFGYLGWAQQHGQTIAPDVQGGFLQHGSQHVQAARSDPQYMKQYGAQIAQFAAQISQGQKAMQQQQAATQQAGMAMANLRGGAPPGMPPPGAPPGMPPPGAPPGMGMPPPGGAPGMPPPQPPPAPGTPPLTPTGALPPGNGSTPGP